MDKDVLQFFFDDMRMRCRKAGIHEERGDVSVEAIRDALARKEVPIVLTNASMVSDENIPHWMVVSRFEGDIVFINNPLNDVPEAVGVEKFERGIGYKDKRCMIAISSRVSENQKKSNNV